MKAIAISSLVLAFVSCGPQEPGAILVLDEVEGCFHKEHRRNVWDDNLAGAYEFCGAQITYNEVEELRKLLLTSQETPDNLLEFVGVTPASVAAHRDQLLAAALPKGWSELGAPLPERFESLVGYDHIAQIVRRKLTRPNTSTTQYHFKVVLPGEPKLKVWSDGGSAWMLPWSISFGENEWTVADPRITLALSRFAEPQSPCGSLLHSEILERAIWSDWYLWSDSLRPMLESDLAAEIYSRLEGFAQLEAVLEVTHALTGKVNLQDAALYSELAVRAPAPIDHVRWWNTLNGKNVTFDWNDLLKVYRDATAAVERQDWLLAWKQADYENEITLESVGTRGHSEFNMDLFVDPIWSDSGLGETPEFELHLTREGVKCGTVFLSRSGLGALIPMARKPGGPSGFGDEDYEFHPRSSPPTYGFVNAAGTFELRTLGD